MTIAAVSGLTAKMNNVGDARVTSRQRHFKLNHYPSRRSG
jgi:hypothetical protein